VSFTPPSSIGGIYNVTLTEWCSTTGNCPAGTTLKAEFRNAINPGWVTDPDTSSVNIIT